MPDKDSRYRQDRPDRPARIGAGCAFAGDEVISHLYGEASAAERERIEAHLAACPLCREERASLQSTIRLVESARLVDLPLASFEADGNEWERLRTGLVAQQRAGRYAAAGRQILRAAGIALLVGSSFWLGSAWSSADGSLGLLRDRMAAWISGSAPLPAIAEGRSVSADDESARLREFARETNGYLNRSRLVLLAFSNATDAGMTADLNRASASLLKEAARARLLARELRDPRLQELVSSLERILEEIARVSSTGDEAHIARFRDSMSLSSVLDQLELLAGGAVRRTQEKSHA